MDDSRCIDSHLKRRNVCSDFLRIQGTVAGCLNLNPHRLIVVILADIHFRRIFGTIAVCRNPDVAVRDFFVQRHADDITVSAFVADESVAIFHSKILDFDKGTKIGILHHALLSRSPGLTTRGFGLLHDFENLLYGVVQSAVIAHGPVTEGLMVHLRVETQQAASLVGVWDIPFQQSGHNILLATANENGGASVSIHLFAGKGAADINWLKYDSAFMPNLLDFVPGDAVVNSALHKVSPLQIGAEFCLRGKNVLTSVLLAGAGLAGSDSTNLLEDGVPD